MDRRQFLRLTGATAVAIGSSGCSAGPEYDVRSLAQPELLATLGAGPVRAIGSRYRSVTPKERDADSLRAAILESRPMRARLLPASSPPISSVIHDDFQKGRTVVLNGWILSLTEARQCALFSLVTA
jgi:hypothetical protein